MEARKSHSLFLFILFYYMESCVECLNNGLARTPPMGWMSWAKFLCQTDCSHYPFTCISEKLYMQMADLLVEDGYRDVGYRSVHIDDCWMEKKRDESGILVADKQRFPSGIKKLAKYMHDRQLQLGIYADAGEKTCEGYPGSQSYMQRDAQTFAQWDCDYVKMDGCYMNLTDIPIAYQEMGEWLNKSDHGMVYSCEWPLYLIHNQKQINYTLIGQYCNLWRNYYDIGMNWGTIQNVIDYYDHHQDEFIPAQGPGQWNDPDMIVVGNVEITPDQSRSQMSLWAIWSAPLIMSNDLRLIAPVYRDILQNRKVIQVDQDPMGVMGRLVANTTDIGVYVKPVIPMDKTRDIYSFAVVIFNRNAKNSIKVSVNFEDIHLSNANGYLVEELWTGENFGLMYPKDDYVIVVAATGVSMFKATAYLLTEVHCANTVFDLFLSYSIL